MRNRGARHSWRGSAAPWVFGTVLVALWYLVSASGRIPGFLLPTPHAVVGRLFEDLTGPDFWPYLVTTLVEATGGCVFGAAIAIPLGVAIHRSRYLNAALAPFLGATQAIPAIAIAPLLVLWVGYGLSAVVVLCTLLVFFPILIATVVGLRHVDVSVIDAARMDGASSWERLRYVELPLALPSVLAGLRNGFTLSITGAVVGEMVMGGQGLGTLLTVQRDSLDTTGMFATIAILCALASIVYVVLHLIERQSPVMKALRGEST